MSNLYKIVIPKWNQLESLHIPFPKCTVPSGYTDLYITANIIADTRYDIPTEIAYLISEFTHIKYKDTLYPWIGEIEFEYIDNGILYWSDFMEDLMKVSNIKELKIHQNYTHHTYPADEFYKFIRDIFCNCKNLIIIYISDSQSNFIDNIDIYKCHDFMPENSTIVFRKGMSLYKVEDWDDTIWHDYRFTTSWGSKCIEYIDIDNIDEDRDYYKQINIEFESIIFEPI